MNPGGDAAGAQAELQPVPTVTPTMMEVSGNQDTKRKRKKKKKYTKNPSSSSKAEEAALQTSELKKKLAIKEPSQCELPRASGASSEVLLIATGVNAGGTGSATGATGSGASTAVTEGPATPATQHRTASPLRELPLDLVQKLWLEVNHLTPLKKRSLKHPNALFMCKLCQYFCMSFDHCEDHIKDQKHCRNSVEEGKYSTLVNLPTPTKNHSDTISELLQEIFLMYGVSEMEREARQKVANEIDGYISKSLPGCRARLYGSSLTGFGLKTSNLNIDFQVAPHLSAPVMLKAAYNLLSQSNIVINVASDFHAEIPTVLFRDIHNQFNCLLSLNSHEAYKTSELLAKYESLDGRVKVLATCFHVWAQICKIDDHLLGMLPAYSYNLMLVYFLQQVQPPVLPVIKDLASDSSCEWTSENTSTVGELWVRLFRFYTVDHPNSENVVCIRSKEPVKRSEKHWTGKKIAIEDPFLRKRNISRYIVNHASHDFIHECFKNTYRYFGVPQTENGPIFALIRKPMDEYRQIPDVERNIKMAEITLNAQMDRDPRFMNHEQPPTSSVHKMISVSELEERFRETSIKNCQEAGNSPAVNPSIQEPKALPFNIPMQLKTSYSTLVVSPKLAQALCSRLKKEFHIFKIDVKMFTLGKLPPIVCNICQQEGHTKNKCPDNYLPPLAALPPMQEPFIRQLDIVCTKILETWIPSKEETEERQSIVNDLEAYLKGRYPTVKLELFGSSCNGFGFHKSDLDICLTFTDNKTGENINYVCLIEELVRELKAYGKLTNLIPITTAKVPIVKFTYPKSKVDCDISLYNTLAQRNTHMLRTYANIDSRVQTLGYTMKRFAKLCDICDASRGSLSSYAYILMVIYFLQQLDPPVLPVLQQLYTTEKQPEEIVEAWNTWFYDDIGNLATVWKDYGKNNASVGQLWLQLLRFYTEEFDFNEYVVCIRQKEKLLRFEKLWNSKCMAIEDPFDLTHNLGSGLSRKMNNFIIKAFRNGRMHFGTPTWNIPAPFKNLLDYLFDTRYLTDGQPPNDRGCRICKKIGHMCKDCPQRKNGKRRPTEKRNASEKSMPAHSLDGNKDAQRAPPFRGGAESIQSRVEHPKHKREPMPFPKAPWNMRHSGSGDHPPPQRGMQAPFQANPQHPIWLQDLSRGNAQHLQRRQPVEVGKTSSREAGVLQPPRISNHGDIPGNSSESVQQRIAQEKVQYISKPELTKCTNSLEKFISATLGNTGDLDITCKTGSSLALSSNKPSSTYVGSIPNSPTAVSPPINTLDNQPINKNYMDTQKLGRPLIKNSSNMFPTKGPIPLNSFQYHPVTSSRFCVPASQPIPETETSQHFLYRPAAAVGPRPFNLDPINHPEQFTFSNESTYPRKIASMKQAPTNVIPSSKVSTYINFGESSSHLLPNTSVNSATSPVFSTQQPQPIHPYLQWSQMSLQVPSRESGMPVPPPASLLGQSQHAQAADFSAAPNVSYDRFNQS